MSRRFSAALFLSILIHGAFFCPWVVWNRIFEVGGLKNQPSYFFSVELIERDDEIVVVDDKTSPKEFAVKTKTTKQAVMQTNQKVDLTSDPILRDYLNNTVRTRIDQYVKSRFPAYLRRKGIKARPVLNFDMNADGSVYDQGLIKRSGHAALDELVLQAIKALSPFPPFPKTLNQQTITGIELAILFQVPPQ